MNLEEKKLEDEFVFKTSRSSGKGGQHVNKTESRVSLFFNVSASKILTDNEKLRLQASPKVNLSTEGNIQVDAETSRSQIKNKKEVIEKFYFLLKNALQVPKKRKISKPSKAAIKKRLEKKKRHSQKKENRKKV